MICGPRMIRQFLITTMVGGALMVSGCAETATGVVLGTGVYLAANPELLPLEDFSDVPEPREPRADLVLGLPTTGLRLWVPPVMRRSTSWGGTKPSVGAASRVRDAGRTM